MENELEWKERYNIGVDYIDGEHRRLFRIVSKLRAFSEQEDKTSWASQEGIKFFKSFAPKHFKEEEVYMESISYKEREIHKRLHEDFCLKRLPAIEQELEETEYSSEAITHLRGICTGWLVDHIETEDQVIAGRGSSKWSNLLPKDEVSVVEQTLMGRLGEIFHKDPRVLSVCYGGEEFGEGICYRLIYGTKKGEKQEVILIFEKKLLFHMMEKITGDSKERSNAMMQEAIRSVAAQLEGMKAYFRSDEKYELKGENQLSFDQFHRALQRQLPKFSLLFDTGEGYFGYCAMTPHLLRNESSAPGGADALKKEPEESAKDLTGIKKEPEESSKDLSESKKEPLEVKKELAGCPKNLSETKKDPPEVPDSSMDPQKGVGDNEQKRSTEKKKVLVVDDSEMVRQVMKGVLQKDYQVELAKSAISAIQSMTLERPDLVLLDYNMPVCDGAQLLYMLRSDDDFADIPVVFLTATIDKASIKKVVPLKPEGYLLKNMKPVDIKKKVDSFFVKERH